jgi:hypothetical protein
MTTLHWLLLLIIIVIISVFSAFMNQPSKISETFIDIMDGAGSPDTPDDLSVFQYLQKNKGWDVNSLSNEEKQVLFSLRMLQTYSYDTNNMSFPVLDACVIPYETFPLYQRSSSDTSPFIINETTLRFTNEDETPSGAVIDLSNTNFQEFRKILKSASDLFNSDYVDQQKRLITIRTRLNRQIVNKTSVLRMLRQQRDTWQSRRASLDMNTNNEQENDCARWASTRKSRQGEVDNFNCKI